MNWMEAIGEALNYIEENITDELTIEEIASKALFSPFYFQKGFAMICGFTVAEYIRLRRLALAGSELVSSDDKIIDIALKYGYDSPDSFTKSFTRFHGSTPSAVRKSGAMIKSFAPLKINFTLKGGCSMNYKIIEKDAFTVIGLSRVFQYEEAAQAVPALWAEFNESPKCDKICSTFGINIDESMSGNKFEYLIADSYNATTDIPEGFVTKLIPKFTWAVFPCKGALPQAMLNLNKRIFSEWLPGCRDYEIAAGYCIETYHDPADYPNQTQDVNYESEMWIPVKRK